MKLTGHEVYMIASALRVAANQYQIDARVAGNQERLVAAFVAQSHEAIAMAERMEGSDVVTID